MPLDILCTITINKLSFQTIFWRLLINLQTFIYFSIKIKKITLLMDELSALSISISIASIGIYCLFFASNDDDDQDGGHLVKAAQKIN